MRLCMRVCHTCCARLGGSGRQTRRCRHARDSEQSCLLYAHIDKQPPMGVWMEGLGPYEPAVKDGKLYGRGAVDDGYGFYCAITSIKAIQAQGLPW